MTSLLHSFAHASTPDNYSHKDIGLEIAKHIGHDHQAMNAEEEDESTVEKSHCEVCHVFSSLFLTNTIKDHALFSISENKTEMTSMPITSYLARLHRPPCAIA